MIEKQKDEDRYIYRNTIDDGILLRYAKSEYTTETLGFLVVWDYSENAGMYVKHGSIDSLSENSPCPNCKETVPQCACIRNLCNTCEKPVGNITFSICDDCWNKLYPKEKSEQK